MNDTEREAFEAWAAREGKNLSRADCWDAWREACKWQARASAPAPEPVAWCALTPNGTIAYFDGKPMVMPGPVGNALHTVPLYAATPPQAAAPAPEPVWKVGNEFAPFHPQASHVNPDYRDGWNACYKAARWPAITEANRAYAPLVRAVIDFLCAVDDKHVSDATEQRHSVPCGALSALRAAVGATPPQAAAPAAVGEPQGWKPMETAPKDGDSVLLLIEDGEHPLQDENPSVTIGSFGVEGGPEEDPTWNFAGWCWHQDCYCRGTGTPIGWLPLAASPAPDRYEATDAPALSMSMFATSADYEKALRDQAGAVAERPAASEGGSGSREPQGAALCRVNPAPNAAQPLVPTAPTITVRIGPPGSGEPVRCCARWPHFGPCVSSTSGYQGSCGTQQGPVALIDHLMAALKTIRDMPMEEQDNTISASMRRVAGEALAPCGEITEADVEWAKTALGASGGAGTEPQGEQP